MNDFLKNIFKFIPSLPKRKVFRLSEAKVGAKELYFVFSAIKEGEHPPYFLRAKRRGKSLQELAVGFIIPKKVPPSEQNWLTYFSLIQFQPFEMLALAINDGEHWGLEFNRFTRDGLRGPPDYLVDDLARALKEGRAKLSAGKKNLVLGGLANLSELVKNDAAGKFMFEASPAPFIPVRQSRQQAHQLQKH